MNTHDDTNLILLPGKENDTSTLHLNLTGVGFYHRALLVFIGPGGEVVVVVFAVLRNSYTSFQLSNICTTHLKTLVFVSATCCHNFIFRHGQRLQRMVANKAICGGCNHCNNVKTIVAEISKSITTCSISAQRFATCHT